MTGFAQNRWGVAWTYRGAIMAITLPSTPRDEEQAIEIARQKVRRRLREAGFEVQAGLGARDDGG